MTPLARTGIMVGAWAAIVIAALTIVVSFIVAACDCSYCGVWDCLKHSFGVR
jgi:hypothetical protein